MTFPTISRGHLRTCAGLVAALWLASACHGGLRPITSGPRPSPGGVVRPVEPGDLGAEVRIALSTLTDGVEVGATTEWLLEGADDGGAVLAQGASGERWRVEQRGGRLRAVRSRGPASAWIEGALTARPSAVGGTMVVGGRGYRGELLLIPTDSGVLVVNRLPMEEYLRGVVPLEIGPDRRPDERAAVEAQAVAARSFAVGRLRERATTRATRGYDMTAGTLDQVYGGMDVERALSDEAVRATAGLVLMYRGQVATTPYHAACGGNTAASEEVWSAAVPYLRSVSDRIPGTRRNYCDIAPRATWTRVLEQDELRRTLDRYLPAYTSVPAGGVGSVRELRVEEGTSSGRVARLALATERGVYRLNGNQIRFVLRDAAGGVLNSTYFTVSRAPVRRGESAPVATLIGRGNGHGVGMCQWGAIGRARAGQDFRTILGAYYPGTSIGYAD